MIRSCTCRLCRDCCKHMPGALLRVSDLERVERQTRRDGESEGGWAIRLFVASDGALLGNSLTGERTQVPNLSLRSIGGGACAHFKNGRCAIYDGRPSGCSDFDCQQTDQEANALGLAMHRKRLDSLQTHPEARYWRLWRMLRDMGRIRSRANLDARFRKLNGVSR